MEIMNKDIRGNHYTFVNDSWETSNAWGHKTTLFKNNHEISNHKIRYYNRTWENYQYQTCMLGAIREVEYEEFGRFIEDYKEKHEQTRLKRGERARLEEMFTKTEIEQELAELKQAVEKRDF